MSREGALWIGGLEPYMDDEFIKSGLALMGESLVHSIKVIKNKFTGEAASYGFINFDNDPAALMAMHKLNGKIIPNSQPPVRYKLNHASTRLNPGEQDHSIWVGDLTPDVDDYQLYKFFSARFQSIKSAKVVLDPSGFSKGYGFIRFGDEQEQSTALHSMQNIGGLGAKPLKVKEKVMFGQRPGQPGAPSTNPAAPSTGLTDSLPASALAVLVSNASGNSNAGMAVVQEAQAQAWNQYYQQQAWAQQTAWNEYQQQQQEGYEAEYAAQPAPPALDVDMSGPEFRGYKPPVFEGDELDLIDHDFGYEYDMENQEYFSITEEIYESSEATIWTPYTEAAEENSPLSSKGKSKEKKKK